MPADAPPGDHIVFSERLGEPSTNRALFDALERGGWVSAELGASLRDMNGFGNVVVHGYHEIDLWIVEDVLENRLDDLLAFCRAVRGRLDDPER